MNFRIVLASAILTLGLPLAAMAGTVTVSTGTSTGVTTVQGCLSSWSNSSDNYSTQSTSISGSAQLVESATGTHLSSGSASNSVDQGDLSLAVTETQETGHDSSGQSFNGSETSVQTTTNSDASTSFSGQ